MRGKVCPLQLCADSHASLAPTAIGIWGIDDVRSTIKAHEGKHIPSEFMKQMRANKEAEEAEWRRKHSKGGKLGFFGNLVSKTLAFLPLASR